MTKTNLCDGRIILYHRTNEAAAAAILRQGFIDHEGRYMVATSEPFRGVWLSNIPLDANEGAKGDVLLEVLLNVTEKSIAKYEWVQESWTYREWLMPAAIINRHAIRRISEEEEDAMIDPRYIQG
jgi:hypothetical protein